MRKTAGSGSALKKTAGSGSAKNKYESTALLLSHLPELGTSQQAQGKDHQGDEEEDVEAVGGGTVEAGALGGAGAVGRLGVGEVVDAAQLKVVAAAHQGEVPVDHGLVADGAEEDEKVQPARDHADLNYSPKPGTNILVFSFKMCFLFGV